MIDMIDNDVNLCATIVYNVISIIFDIDTFIYLLSKKINHKDIEALIFWYLYRCDIRLTMEIIDIISPYVDSVLFLRNYAKIDTKVVEYMISRDIIFSGWSRCIPEYYDLLYNYGRYNNLIDDLCLQLNTNPLNYDIIIKILDMIHVDQYKCYLSNYSQSHDILTLMDELGIDMYLRVLNTVSQFKHICIKYNQILNKLHLDNETLQCIICHLLIYKDEDEDEDEE
jgi:hypothetical protein